MPLSCFRVPLTTTWLWTSWDRIRFSKSLRFAAGLLLWLCFDPLLFHLHLVKKVDIVRRRRKKKGALLRHFNWRNFASAIRRVLPDSDSASNWWCASAAGCRWQCPASSPGSATPPRPWFHIPWSQRGTSHSGSLGRIPAQACRRRNEDDPLLHGEKTKGYLWKGCCISRQRSVGV